MHRRRPPHRGPGGPRPACRSRRQRSPPDHRDAGRPAIRLPEQEDRVGLPVRPRAAPRRPHHRREAGPSHRWLVVDQRDDLQPRQPNGLRRLGRAKASPTGTTPIACRTSARWRRSPTAPTSGAAATARCGSTAPAAKHKLYDAFLRGGEQAGYTGHARPQRTTSRGHARCSVVHPRRCPLERVTRLPATRDAPTEPDPDDDLARHPDRRSRTGRRSASRSPIRARPAASRALGRSSSALARSTHRGC